MDLGKVDLTFGPTAASKRYWAGRPDVRIVQALHWLRDPTGQDEEDQRFAVVCVACCMPGSMDRLFAATRPMVCQHCRLDAGYAEAYDRAAAFGDR